MKKTDNLADKICLIAAAVLLVYQTLTAIFPGIESLLFGWVSDPLKLHFAGITLLIIPIFNKVSELTSEKRIKSGEFNACLEELLEKEKSFDNVSIFAYSAKHYVSQIAENKVQIKNLRLLLKRANDKTAWFVKDAGLVKRYQEELKSVLDTLGMLVSKEPGDGKPIKNLEIRYYDFETYSHFGLFDNYLISGMLIPEYNTANPMQIGEVQVVKSGLGHRENKKLIKTDKDFYESVWKQSGEDSGLKRKDHSCKMFNLLKSISGSDGSIVGKSNSTDFCITDHELFEDFILKPDQCPVSNIHILCVCKYHILNIYDYLKHENGVKNLENIVYSVAKAIKKHCGKDIIVFEHGASRKGSPFNAKSVDHLICHIIIKPDNFDFKEFIRNNAEEVIDFSNEENAKKYKNLHILKDDISLRMKDYFLIWDVCDNNPTGNIYVYRPREKEPQFLRKVFYKALTSEQKSELFPAYKENGPDNYYKWELYKDNLRPFTKIDEESYYALGREISNEFKALKK